MHSKNLVTNDCSNRKTVEAIYKRLPQFDTVSSLAFVIKAIDAINRGAFVIATQKKEVFRVFNLVGKKKTYRLDRVLTSIDVVS